MNREASERYITETYSTGADHPWAAYPNYAVFRHASNRKWFAVVLEVPWKSLGQPGEGGVDVLNVKCDPLLTGSFRQEPGIYPAYHMNKANWLPAALDGSAEDGTIQTLLDMSVHLTAPKKRKGGSTP